MVHTDGDNAPAFGNRGRVFGPWKKTEPVVTVYDPPLPQEPPVAPELPDHGCSAIVYNNIYFDFGKNHLCVAYTL